jgi:hypothetical protein
MLVMGRSQKWFRIGRAVVCCAICILSANSTLGGTEASIAPAPAPCSGPEARQLDFWLGEWDLSWPALGESPAGKGTNRITKTLAGCVIEENFSSEGPAGLVGKSISSYDAARKQWHQTWVDDKGSYLDLAGGKTQNGFALSMKRNGSDGKPVLARMRFLNIAADSFDWRWERSADDGKTWRLQWPIHYARKEAARS